MQSVAVPFVQRTMNSNSIDPTEAMADTVAEAQQLEKTLRQCVQISQFMVDKNKELVEDNHRVRI